MKTQWSACSRDAGEISLRLLILGAAVCAALYFFARPKPAPVVAEAPPVPVPTTVAPATPPPVAMVAVVPGPAAEPTVEPPEIVAVALPPPLDLATVARTPALWPKQVTLLQPALFPVVVNGRVAGNATLPTGTALRLLRIVGAQVEVEYQNGRQLLPAGSTDLMPRALAAAKAAAPAPVSPPSNLASAGAPPPGAVEAAPPPAAAPQADTAPAGKIPALRVQAMVGTSSRRKGASSYVKEMTIKPKAIIEGASRMTAIPPLDATMIVITMGTMAKYVAGQEAYSVRTVETMPLAAAANGEARTLTFAESTVTFDSWRDDSNIGGQVYKYFVFGVVDPATKTVVDFQTNNPGLAALCKKRPEKREEFLNLKVRAKFPANF